jgi:hypothetical protein
MPPGEPDVEMPGFFIYCQLRLDHGWAFGRLSEFRMGGLPKQFFSVIELAAAGLAGVERPLPMRVRSRGEK